MTDACPSSERLRDLLDDRLGPDDESGLTSHVETCVRCQQILEEWTADPCPSLGTVRLSRLQGDGRHTVDFGTAAPRRSVEPLPSIPGYRVLSILGRGGMGVVYKVIDERLKRPAAMKMLRHDQRAEHEARFLIEAESLARLQHPNIVQIFEAGSHDQRPYLVMELVEGGTLAEWLSGRPMPPRPAAELLLTLASAVHAAHRQGIVHRDLKPANILLASLGRQSQDAAEMGDRSPPLAGAVPKIADFGLAKQLDSGISLTRTGVIAGTPSYMAPEQVKEVPGAIGPGTDVYSLGAILYESLTGHPPFTAATPLETVRQVVERDPAGLRILQPNVPRDLETICLKCLSKESSCRYLSAEALADDLRRFLDGRAIRARPASGLDHLLRWVRRSPTTAALTLAFLLAVLVGSVVASLFALEAAENARAAVAEADRARYEKDRADDSAREATREAANARREKARADDEARNAALKKDEAVEQLGRSETLLYSLQMTNVQHEWQAGEAAQARSLLASTDKKQRGWEFDYLDTLFNNPDVKVHRGHRGIVSGLALNPDGNRLVSTGWDKSLLVRDFSSGSLRHVLGRQSQMSGAAFSRDGTRLAAACWDRTARLWDTKTWREIRSFQGHGFALTSVVFSADGRTLITASGDTTVRFWETATGKELRVLRDHKVSVNGLVLSRDGRRLATAGGDRVVRLWDAATGQCLRVLEGHQQPVVSVAFSPDDRRLASAGNDRTIRIWDVETGKELRLLLGHRDSVSGIAFSPDGKRLVSGSHDRTVAVWNLESNSVPRLHRGHEAAVASVLFTADGKHVVSGSNDGTVRVWKVEQPQDYVLLLGNGDQALFDPVRGTILDSAQGTIRAPGQAEGMPPLGMRHIAVCPRGKHLVGCGSRGEFTIWDMETRRKLHEPKTSPPPLKAAFSPDGATIAVVHHQGELSLWKPETGLERLRRPTRQGQAECLVYSVDGTSIALGGADGVINLWDATRLEPQRSWHAHKGPITSLVRHPDGVRLFSAGHDRAIRIWNVKTGAMLLEWTGHLEKVGCLALNPDGSRLASGSLDRTLRIWETSGGRPLLTLTGTEFEVTSVCFSPDGRSLVSTGDGVIRLWMTRP